MGNPKRGTVAIRLGSFDNVGIFRRPQTKRPQREINLAAGAPTTQENKPSRDPGAFALSDGPLALFLDPDLVC